MTTTNEWRDLPTFEDVADAKRAGDEIECVAGTQWVAWNQVSWSVVGTYRARPRQPKMKKAKLYAYLSEYELRWLNIDAGNKPAPHWIYVPSEDKEIEVPE